MMEENYFVCQLKDGSYKHFDCECNYIDKFLDGKCIAFKNINEETKKELTLAVVPIDSILIIENHKKYLQEPKQFLCIPIDEFNDICDSAASFEELKELLIEMQK